MPQRVLSFKGLELQFKQTWLLMIIGDSFNLHSISLTINHICVQTVHDSWWSSNFKQIWCALRSAISVVFKNFSQEVTIWRYWSLPGDDDNCSVLRYIRSHSVTTERNFQSCCKYTLLSESKIADYETVLYAKYIILIIESKTVELKEWKWSLDLGLPYNNELHFHLKCQL